MTSLLNTKRPPVFCPGCSHDRAVHALDQALVTLGLPGNRVAIVTDIGCSGLFDTFFNTHALHGLHGRALTYASGLKMARPDLTVITIMGDGGLGIGGAHVLSSCRRNLDITLLVLNNFNYGMTGGQCSATTPAAAATSSGFLNQLEAPLDICSVAAAAGAPYTDRIMATAADLPERLRRAIAYEGFALLDMWGVCPGRFSKLNRTSLGQMQQALDALPPATGAITANQRQEYGSHYLKQVDQAGPIAEVQRIKATLESPLERRTSILLLGAAGLRINTAGELLCLSAMTAGLHVSQKNDYPITVLRGHSISEVIVSRTPIAYTGISKPDIVIALAPEGIARRAGVFSQLGQDDLVLAAAGLTLPQTRARVIEVDFKQSGITSGDLALFSLGHLTRHTRDITAEMLRSGCSLRFDGTTRQKALAVVDRSLD